MFDFGCWILITFFSFSFSNIGGFDLILLFYGEVLILFLDFFTAHFCEFFFIYIYLLHIILNTDLKEFKT